MRNGQGDNLKKQKEKGMLCFWEVKRHKSYTRMGKYQRPWSRGEWSGGQVS